MGYTITSKTAASHRRKNFGLFGSQKQATSNFTPRAGRIIRNTKGRPVLESSSYRKNKKGGGGGGKQGLARSLDGQSIVKGVKLDSAPSEDPVRDLKLAKSSVSNILANIRDKAERKGGKRKKKVKVQKGGGGGTLDGSEEGEEEGDLEEEQEEEKEEEEPYADSSSSESSLGDLELAELEEGEGHRRKASLYEIEDDPSPSPPPPPQHAAVNSKKQRRRTYGENALI